MTKRQEATRQQIIKLNERIEEMIEELSPEEVQNRKDIMAIVEKRNTLSQQLEDEMEASLQEYNKEHPFFGEMFNG